jgi:hypothetical protein
MRMADRHAHRRAGAYRHRACIRSPVTIVFEFRHSLILRGQLEQVAAAIFVELACGGVSELVRHLTLKIISERPGWRRQCVGGTSPAYAAQRDLLSFARAPVRRALAVLRFMMSSTLVACCTGRSAGLSPLRTRPV